jgi:transposase
MPEGLKTIVADCLAHGRRYFVDVAANFPEECLYVLEVLKDVYKNNAEAKDRGYIAAAAGRFLWGLVVG